MASRKKHTKTQIVQEEDSDSTEASASASEEPASVPSSASSPAVDKGGAGAVDVPAAQSTPTVSRSSKEPTRARSKKSLTVAGNDGPATNRKSRKGRDKTLTPADFQAAVTQQQQAAAASTAPATPRTSRRNQKAPAQADEGVGKPAPTSEGGAAAASTTIGEPSDRDSLVRIEQKLAERARKLQQAKELITQTKNQFNAHVFSVEKQLDHRERMLIVSQQELAQERHRLQQWAMSLELKEEELKRREQNSSTTPSVSTTTSPRSSSPPTSPPPSSSSPSGSSSSSSSPPPPQQKAEASASGKTKETAPSSKLPGRRQATIEVEQSRARSTFNAQDDWPGEGSSGETILVVDNGTFEVRAGLSSVDGDAAPPCQLRNKTAGIVERLDEDALLLTYVRGIEGSKSWFEKKQQARRKAVDVLYPLHDTLLANQEHCETVLNHMYELMRLRPRDQPLQLTVSDFASVAELQTSTEFLFETLGVRDLSYLPQSVASLASVGLHTGVSVDIGYSSTRIVACYGGSAIARQKMPLGWQHLFDAVQAAVVKHHASAEALPSGFIDEMTRAALYVAPSFDAELKNYQAQAIQPYLYDLPLQHVQPIDLTVERFRVAEALFRPSNLGVQSPGLQHAIRAVASSVFADRSACQEQLRGFDGSVLLSGGGSQIQGLWPRLRSELQAASASSSSSASASSSSTNSAPPQLNLLPPVEDAHLNTWTGALRFARSPGSKNRVTKDQYDEHGPAFLERAFW